jgi:hypothetical protein
MNVMASEACHDVASLNDLMEFQHGRLLGRLQKKLGIDTEDAQDLFEDLKRFLFIAGTTKEPMAPPERIDEAWHHFILFTRDYEDFCEKFFGKFIHHKPYGPEEIAANDGSIIKRTIARTREVFGDVLSENWSYAAADCDQCAGSTNCQSTCNTQ